MGPVAVRPLTATDTYPVDTPAGTVTISWVALALMMFALFPLKKTLSFTRAVLNPVPVIVSLIPVAPEVGLIEVIFSVAEEGGGGGVGI